MARKPKFDYNLIVIGSGAAGSPAASIAAQAGKKVAVIEKDVFGGESPNWGDIPIKSLLHAAQLYDEAKLGSRFGIRSNTLGYNFLSLKKWKDTAVRRTGAGNNRNYYEKQGIATFQSPAHFLSPHEISVSRRHLSAEQFLIATGSTWAMPDIPGIKNIRYHTPRTILDISRLPKTLLVLGGAANGLEYSQLFASLGTKVFIIERAARLLPDEDEEAGLLLAKTLSESKGVSVLTESKILSLQKDGLGNRVKYLRGGVEKSFRVDEILVTTGRAPTVDIGLENASVAYTPKGINVNNYLQTSARHIFAAGDVLGTKKHLHTALLESRVVAYNLLHKQKQAVDYTASPNITFTHPGVASAGLSEDDCIKRDLNIKIGLAPLKMIARSNTSDYRDGFVKIIARRDNTVIGGTIVAPHAGEMIHEISLAIKYELTTNEVANTPHAFLSWSEAIRLAAIRAGTG